MGEGLPLNRLQGHNTDTEVIDEYKHTSAVKLESLKGEAAKKGDYVTVRKINAAIEKLN